MAFLLVSVFSSLVLDTLVKEHCSFDKLPVLFVLITIIWLYFNIFFLFFLSFRINKALPKLCTSNLYPFNAVRIMVAVVNIWSTPVIARQD